MYIFSDIFIFKLCMIKKILKHTIYVRTDRMKLMDGIPNYLIFSGTILYYGRQRS